MALIPAQNGGQSSSGKKCCRGDFDATGSEQTILFSNYNLEGDDDFTPRFLFVYKMFPNSISGSSGNLSDGTHMNVYDALNYSNFAYRGLVSGTTPALYRSDCPTSTGGARIRNVFAGGFTFAGSTSVSGRYHYVAME